MLSNKEWEAKRKELEELEKQKKEIAKKIHILKVSLNQHGKHCDNKVRTDTEVYKMFGKKLKDLTPEEYKVYYNARQRINRQKRKAKTDK